MWLEKSLKKPQKFNICFGFEDDSMWMPATISVFWKTVVGSNVKEHFLSQFPNSMGSKFRKYSTNIK